MEEKQAYFPMFVSLAGKKVLIVGGGRVAARRVETLLEFSCDITVVAPQAEERIVRWQEEGRLTWERRTFHPKDVSGAFFVIAAADDRAVNDSVAACCRAEQIIVNHAGDKAQCDFYFPGIVKKEQVVIGVTASGSDHGLVKKITRWLRQQGKKTGGNEI